MSGELFIVGTPIGNLEDITFRAIRTLKEADLILCEDKRITSKLLEKYEIKAPLKSYHKFNEAKNSNEIIEKLLTGEKMALVSDAGTPIISDPGAKLVSIAIEAGIKVTPIPGASSLTTALSVFGNELKEFLYVGFLPEKKSERNNLIKSLKGRSNFIVIFTGPHDLKKYLSEIKEIYPSANISIARELTKMHEELFNGSISDALKSFEERTVKGEIVLGLDLSKVETPKVEIGVILKEMKSFINEGNSLKEASKFHAKKHGLSSKALYDAYIGLNH